MMLPKRLAMDRKNAFPRPKSRRAGNGSSRPPSGDARGMHPPCKRKQYKMALRGQKGSTIPNGSPRHEGSLSARIMARRGGGSDASARDSPNTKNIFKNFQKNLDKPNRMWYTIQVNEARPPSPPCRIGAHGSILTPSLACGGGLCVPGQSLRYDFYFL